MKKEKSIDELEKSIVKENQKKNQLENQIRRLKNRQNYYEKGERSRRTHRFCTRAGAVEPIEPRTRELTDSQFFELMEQTFAHPEIQKILNNLLSVK